MIGKICPPVFTAQQAHIVFIHLLNYSGMVVPFTCTIAFAQQVRNAPVVSRVNGSFYCRASKPSSC